MGWSLLFNMKIEDILSFEEQTYSFGEHNYTEHTLRTQCDPLSLLQLLAFNGRMHAGDGNVVQLHDWEKLPPAVLTDFRETIFTSLSAVLNGTRGPEPDGSYIFKSVAVEATVQGGMISFPDPKQAKAKARNLKKRTLL